MGENAEKIERWSCKPQIFRGQQITEMSEAEKMAHYQNLCFLLELGNMETVWGGGEGGHRGTGQPRANRKGGLSSSLANCSNGKL